MIQSPVYEKMVFNRDNVDLLVPVGYRRKVRERAVSSFHGTLLNKEPLLNPLFVNSKGGVMRVVDGNHRVEALKRYLHGTGFLKDKQTSRSVEMMLAKYKDLTEEEEKLLYDELNEKVVPQTITDFINEHFDDVPIFQMIDDDFPITTSVYSRRDAIRFQTLFYTWLCRESAVVEMRGIRKPNLLNTLKSLNASDYSDMVQFFKKYKEIFGLPQSLSPYYKSGPLWIVMSLYYRNKGVINTELFWTQVKIKLFQNVLMLDAAKHGAREFLNDTRRILLEKFNQGWRGNKLV